MQEPWDGPAAVCFTDGKLIGATLDRNGLRPCRYQVTTDGTGGAGVRSRRVARWMPRRFARRAGFMPGRMFLVDTVQGRIIDDEEMKADIVEPQTLPRLGDPISDFAR